MQTLFYHPSGLEVSIIKMALFQVACSLIVFVCVTDLAFGQGGYIGRQRGGGSITRCPPFVCGRTCPGDDYVYDRNGCRTCTCRHRPQILHPPQPEHIPSLRCPPNNVFTPCVVGPDQCSSNFQCGNGQICCPRGCNRECVYPVGHAPPLQPIHRPNRGRQRGRVGRRGTGRRWQNPRY